MIKTIIFDYGGVVFEAGTTSRIIKFSHVFNAPRKVVYKLMSTKPRKEGAAFRAGKMTAREFWKIARKKMNMSQKQADHMKKLWFEAYTPRKGMLDLLKKLKKNYRLVVFSGNTRERVRYLNKKYKVRGFVFRDDTFVLDKKRVYGFCERLIEENLDFC